MTARDAVLYLAFEYGTNTSVRVSEFNPEWFGIGPYFDRYKKTWSAIMEWKADGNPPDAIAFETRFRLGFGDTYVACKEANVAPSSWGTFVQDLINDHATQALGEMLAEVAGATDTTNPQDRLKLFKDFARRLESAEMPVPVELRSPKDVATEFLEEMESRSKREGPEMTFGFPEIDRRFNGLCRGRIYTVAARTGIGKSVFCLNVASNLITQGKRVLYFSTEMDWKDKWARFMAIRTGIWSSHFNQGRFQDGELVKIKEETERLYETDSFHVCDLSSPNIGQIRSAVERAKPDVVILDYIGLFDFGSRAVNRTQEIGHFMKKVKHLGRQAEVAMIVVSQLNRGAEFNPATGSSRTPQISDIRDCGEIEQDSDGIILLYMKTGLTKEEVQMLDVLPVFAEIGKNRHGGQGRFMLDFEKYVLRMREAI